MTQKLISLFKDWSQIGEWNQADQNRYLTGKRLQKTLFVVPDIPFYVVMRRQFNSLACTTSKLEWDEIKKKFLLW
jgi:hypothetical protein